MRNVLEVFRSARKTGQAGSTRLSISWAEQGDLTFLQRVEELVVAVGLKELLENKYFCICKLESILKVARITPPKRIMDILHVLHCVDYADMPVQLRKDVLILLAEIFNAEEIKI